MSALLNSESGQIALSRATNAVLSSFTSHTDALGAYLHIRKCVYVDKVKPSGISLSEKYKDLAWSAILFLIESHAYGFYLAAQDLIESSKVCNTQ